MVETKSPHIVIDQDRIKTMIQCALEGRDRREGIFASEIIPPEEEFVNIAKRYETNYGPTNFALHSVFFLTPNIFADNSAMQLKKISQPALFIPYAWLFKPDQIAKRTKEEVEKEARNLVRPGHNRSALEKWHHNAAVLCDRYQGNLINFFEDNQFDAPIILNQLMGPRTKEKWEGFHRFGPKIGRLFLQWVKQYNLAELKNMDQIGIPVDFQVARLVIQTGGIKIDEPVHKHWILDKTLTPLFTGFCKEYGFPQQLTSETLWLIGNRCCNNRKHNLCPLEDMCDRLIARNPSLKLYGTFDPKDTGRYKYPRNTEKQIQAGQKVMVLV